MDREREILAINVDQSCTMRCEGCERFFDCRSPLKQQMYEGLRLKSSIKGLEGIKYKIAVAAGKGGVGKSTLTASLATAFAARGYSVTVLDQDFDGPSVPRMLGTAGKRLMLTDNGIKPQTGFLGIQIVSMGYILREEDVLTWFHQMRRGATQQFLSYVMYGERDLLIVDLPPGTSSDVMNVMECIPDLNGAVIVTIPSEVSQSVARRAAHLFRKAKVPVLGIVENMSGVVCADCGSINYVLGCGGGERLAQQIDMPFLGKVPLDQRLMAAMDEGLPFLVDHPDSAASQALQAIAAQIEQNLGMVPAR